MEFQSLGQGSQDEFLHLDVLIELAVFYIGLTNPKSEKPAFRLEGLFCFKTVSGICAESSGCQNSLRDVYRQDL